MVAGPEPRTDCNDLVRRSARGHAALSLLIADGAVQPTERKRRCSTGTRQRGRLARRRRQGAPQVPADWAGGRHNLRMVRFDAAHKGAPRAVLARRGACGRVRDDEGYDFGFEFIDSDGSRTTRSHPQRRPEVVVKAVCEECNNGWMSSLEAQVRPFLEPMVRGGDARLTVADQMALARWAAKSLSSSITTKMAPSLSATTISARSTGMASRRPAITCGLPSDPSPVPSPSTST